MSSALLARLRASFPTANRSASDVKGHTSRLKTVFSKAYEMHTKYNGTARVIILVEADGGRIMYDSDHHLPWAPVQPSWSTGVDVVQPGSFITQDQTGGHANMSPANGSSHTSGSSSTVSPPNHDIAHVEDRPTTPVWSPSSLGASPPPMFEGSLTPASNAASPAMNVPDPSINDRKRGLEAVGNSEASLKAPRPQKKSKQLFK